MGASDPRTMDDAATARDVSALRFVVFGMIFGLAAMTAAALFFAPSSEDPAATIGGERGVELGTVLSAILVVLGGSSLVGGLILRRGVEQQARARFIEEGADDSAAIYRSATIVSAALAEGVGLFGAVGHFLTGHPLLLAGPVLAIVALLRILPSDARRRAFLARVRDGRGTHEALMD